MLNLVRGRYYSLTLVGHRRGGQWLCDSVDPGRPGR